MSKRAAAARLREQNKRIRGVAERINLQQLQELPFSQQHGNTERIDNHSIDSEQQDLFQQEEDNDQDDTGAEDVDQDDIGEQDLNEEQELNEQDPSNLKKNVLNGALLMEQLFSIKTQQRKRLTTELIESESESDVSDGSENSEQSAEAEDQNEQEIYDYDNSFELKSALEDPQKIAAIRLMLSKLTVDDFSILNIGEHITSEFENFQPADDDGMDFFCGSMLSKGDFTRDIRRWSRGQGVSTAAEEQLLIVLQKYLPLVYFKLPLRVTQRKRLASTTLAYERPSNRDLWFDVCTSSCCVFVGPYATVDHCPECNLERFHPCSKAKCKKNNKCTCLARDRRAVKQIHYRPMIPLIKRLVAKSSFRAALRCAIPQKSRHTISDLMHGSLAQDELAIMHQRFQEFCDAEKSKQAEEVSLLLSEFYDGAQVFKRRISSFWPLFISILNLPPTYRNRVGVGMFLASLFTAANGSVAEHFLFSQCLIAELIALDKGIIYEHDGVTFFIQARLIRHICDGRALEKMCKVQGAGALFGCPLCEGLHGLSRKKEMDRVVYLGHRGFCAHSFFARSYGQTQICCQSGLYDRTDGDNEMLPGVFDYAGK